MDFEDIIQVNVDPYKNLRNNDKKLLWIAFYLEKVKERAMNIDDGLVIVRTKHHLTSILHRLFLLEYLQELPGKKYRLTDKGKAFAVNFTNVVNVVFKHHNIVEVQSQC